MEQMQEAEVIELTLESKIETALVKHNVTQAVIATLKEKYGNLKLKALDDKESYLELKAAAKDCSKIRNLAMKVCKEGREDAIKVQKLWVAKQNDVIGQIAEVEDPLDAEIAKYDAEVERKANEEKQRQEEAYINRQQVLTRMGATYTEGNFILGNASFEAVLIKGASQDVWDEAIVPKFRTEYEKIEAVKVEEEHLKVEKEATIKAEQEKLRAEQEAFRLQQEEFNRQKAEAFRVQREKEIAEENEKILAQREAQFEIMKKQAEEQAEAKRLADIELAIQKEKDRQAEAERQAEITRQQEAARKQAELEAAGDKVKWETFIKQVKEIGEFEMRSGQYRKKMQIAKEKLEEILSL